MIERIQGTLLEKNPTHAVVDCNGVGYGLTVSLPTFESLGEPGSVVSLFTYLHVREDILQLFGFSAESERELFLLLISVNKIGPKIAVATLSGISVAGFAQAIRSEDIVTLTKIPGIGRQSAERLILELKKKIDRVRTDEGSSKGAGSAALLSEKAFSEAIMALETLGYKRIHAEKAVLRVGEERGKALPVEEIIKSALKYV
ncbi:MAG: Holliday junction branch migration protein RuvA [Fibrobacterota bacterium]